MRTCTPEGLEAVYRGLDNSDRCTLVRLSGPVQEVDEACLQLSLQLEPRRPRRLCLVLDFHPDGNRQPPTPEAAFDAALEAAVDRFREASRLAASMSSDNPAFNSWTMVCTPTPGCPGSVAPSGAMA